MNGIHFSVLLIQEERIILEFIQEISRQLSCTIMAVTSTKEGNRAIDSGGFDMIIAAPHLLCISDATVQARLASLTKRPTIVNISHCCSIQDAIAHHAIDTNSFSSKVPVASIMKGHSSDNKLFASDHN